MSAPTRRELLEILLTQHTKNMRNPRYWHNKRLQQSDMKICLMMSDIRLELRQEEA